MKALQMFSIPIKGLGVGKHNFEYSLDSEFFKNFEDSEIKAGDYEVGVALDKQERMMEFYFDIKGSYIASCDRCLEEIAIPSLSNERLLVKIGNQSSEDENEEVIYIDENDQDINLAPFIHEFIHLSKPLQNVIDCEENGYEFCDERVLDKLEGESKQKKQDPTWDQLKNIELG